MTDRFGLSVALATPFHEDGSIDLQRLASHAAFCLAGGCDSVTAFGTTGEAASLSRDERERVLGALAAGGIAGRKLVVGVTASAVDDAVAQARLGYAFGCRALLMAPPFYFKDPAAEGVFDWFSAVIGRLGSQARDILLYNIPSMTAVALPVPLIQKLRDAFPGIVVGVKDSSCDWDYTQALLAGRGSLAILVGDERDLAAAVRLGGQGAICGAANILPGAMRPLAHEGREDRRLLELIEAMVALPVIPALKALIASSKADEAWARVRAPLRPLPASDAATLRRRFEAGFAAKAA